MDQHDAAGIDRGTGSTRTRQWAKKGGLVAAGLLAGGLLAGTLTANAATPSSGGGSSSSSAGQPADPGPGHGLDLSGTVTAVGSAGVSIQTSSGTKDYTVTSSSDIDKNGEAQLSDLAVGDAVTFSTESDGTTIDKLHSGDESKNRPSGPPPAGSAGGSASSSGTTNG